MLHNSFLLGGGSGKYLRAGGFHQQQRAVDKVEGMNIENIKHAIEQLESSEVTELWQWLAEHKAKPRFELLTWQQLDELADEKEKNRQWAITPRGMECKKDGYEIEASRLHEMSWLLHMAEKKWVNMNDFVPCFFAARHHHFPALYPSLQDIRDGTMDKGPT